MPNLEQVAKAKARVPQRVDLAGDREDVQRPSGDAREQGDDGEGDRAPRLRLEEGGDADVEKHERLRQRRQNLERRLRVPLRLRG